MGLLASYRKFWFLIGLGLLAVPMVVHAVTPGVDRSEREQRTLGPAPAWPQSFSDISRWPRVTDKFLSDHFGLRERLVRANARLRYALQSPTNLLVLYGRDSQLYFDGDAMMNQSMGLLRRETDIETFATFAEQLNAKLRSTNAKLLVTIPPNSATISRRNLPNWARQRQRPTEYDLMLTALARHGVPALDLRPTLFSAQKVNPIYRRTDTHWNNLGALTAYNAVVEALAKPDWTIEQEKVFRGFEPVIGGDLGRMLGVSADILDTQAKIDLAPYAPSKLTITPINTDMWGGGDLVETGRAGPTVLVLGDSFTRYFWQDYFGLHVGRYVWIHGELCGFKPELIDLYKPDIVVYAPTERFMFCWNL